MCLAPARFLCQSAGDCTWSIALQLHAILVGNVADWFFSYHGELRAAVRKYRLGVYKMKKSKIPKLCQNIGLGKLFLEK